MTTMEIFDESSRLGPPLKAAAGRQSGSMIRALIKQVFGCSHRRLSRPITPSSQPGGPRTDMYEVGLACGEQFTYDWKQMRIGERIEQPPPRT